MHGFQKDRYKVQVVSHLWRSVKKVDANFESWRAYCIE